MFLDLIVVFLSYFSSFELCGNLRGVVTHLRDVLKVRVWEVLLANTWVFSNVVDVAPRSILWDLNFHHVAPLDNGYLQDKEFGILRM